MNKYIHIGVPILQMGYLIINSFYNNQATNMIFANTIIILPIQMIFLLVISINCKSKILVANIQDFQSHDSENKTLMNIAIKRIKK